MTPRKWTEKDLRHAIKSSRSIRQVLKKLGLKEAGGNYEQVKKYINLYKISVNHFKGKAWSKGLKLAYKPKISLKDILVRNSNYQSFKLKNRLVKEGLKEERCELCGWAKKSLDGRTPLELDHINGNRKDNRLENLRILCPNCHSLQPTHRGKNIRK
jgi:hypothetical protein